MKIRPHIALLTPNVLLLAGFLLIPLAMLLVVSFHGYESGIGITQDYSAENYLSLLNGYYFLVLGKSLRLGVEVTVLCVVLGFPMAIALSQSQGWGRSILYFVTLLPLLISAVSRTYGWMILLSGGGAVNKLLMHLGIINSPVRFLFTEAGVVVALTAVLLPFMVLALDTVLLTIHPNLYEAARNLGAGRIRRFFQITIPLCMPGLVSGSVLVFALAISSFVTPSLIGGSRFQIMPTIIYQQAVVLLNWPFGAAIAFAMLFVLFLLLMAALAFTRAIRLGGMRISRSV